MFEEISDFQDSRDSLAEFLMQVKQLLIFIAFEGYLDRIEWRPARGLALRGRHLELYRDAMREYMDSERFEALLEAVRGLEDERIVASGLSGAQLFVKRETVRVSERRFLRSPTAGLFRRFLQAADNLLKSILDATGAGSALEELKEVAGLLPEPQ
jgi:hypothetical protein